MTKHEAKTEIFRLSTISGKLQKIIHAGGNNYHARAAVGRAIDRIVDAISEMENYIALSE